MPSPFPGMNPYLERAAVWHDFHSRFLPAAAEALAAQVVPDYFVRVEDNLYIRDAWSEEVVPAGVSDVSVSRIGPARSAPVSTAAATALSTTVTLPEALDLERLPYLEVVDRESEQVVTVVELLSPSNKRAGANRQDYLAKRRRLLQSDVNLVEIDLLRGHRRMPPLDPLGCDYCVLVSRAEERPAAGVALLRLRDPLPAVPVPLRPGTAEPVLDLGAVLDRVYDAAQYRYILYRGEPEPRLAAADAEWSRAVVAAGVS